MVTILLLFFLLGLSKAETCLALSMEGGGSHGAFEAGSVWQLVNTLPAASVAYNVVTGISTGALNAGGVAQFAIGNEKPMADFLINTWLTLNGSGSIFKEWDGGLVEGILLQGGVYDNRPLIATLKKEYTYGINRNITIGATNLDTGIFQDFNESLGSANLLTAITCSACPPWYFPPTNFLGSTWVDGGCTINLDVFAAVERCLDVVSDQSQITVDMIYDSQCPVLPAETNMTTLDVFTRVRQIHNYDSQMWFYYNAVSAYPKVNYRYIIFPSAYMPGGEVPLVFNQTVLEFEVQLGKNDTANIINGKTDGKQVLLERYQATRNIIYA